MTVDSTWLIEFFRRQARLGFEEGDYTRTRNSCRGVLKELPDDPEALSLLGDAALASHDAAVACKTFDRLLELDPGNAQHALKLGKAYLQIQDWVAAAAAFKQVLELEPEHGEAAQSLVLVEQLQERLHVLGQVAAYQPGRNEPCSCGSGLKYKKCCLQTNTQQILKQCLEQASQAEDWERVISLAGEILTPTAQDQRAEALARYHLEQRADAYPLVVAARRNFPKDPEVLAALADLELDHNVTEAEALASLALAFDPGQWLAHLVLSACCSRTNRLEKAESILRELIRNNPQCDLAWQRLSTLLRKNHRLPDDLLAMREWTQKCPENPDAWCHLGMSTVTAEANLEEARAYLEKALSLKPEHHEALCWLGLSYQHQQNPQTALGYLLQGLQLKSDYQLGWNMLGAVYHSVGRQHEAEGCFMRAIAISPKQSLSWNNLANTYLDASLLDEAEKVMRVALDINQNEAVLWNNLGNILGARKRLREAYKAYVKALEIAPEFKQVFVNLAGIESQFGDFNTAVEQLRQVLDNPLARTNILFTVNYHPDWTGPEVFSVYREVVDGYFPKRKYFSHKNERSAGRKLRIGYVSPDFCHHVCSYFIEPLMRNHDHENFEIFAYSLVKREDHVTERFVKYADHWRLCTGLTSEAIAEQIYADQIDILVDLAGHTGNNRLEAFAMKPAPVQVSWWVGFAFGSGLEQMDYFLADEQMLPPGCESSFAENLWRMPAPAIVYEPSVAMPELSDLPALKNGYITFGSLTRPIRVNYKVIRAWSELLKRVPNSKLILDSHSFQDTSLCDYYRSEFAKNDIPAHRLVIGFTSPVSAVLKKIDIALDCFPHNSGTTLFESLWMGLPFVSLRDRPSMGRVGATILHGVGRDEWIANDETQYVDKLVTLASDVPALAKLRAGLREEMQASPLCNGPDFTRRMELTYREMWQRYCEEGEQ
ncbi:tetratricopeptide repeat protein [Pseudomonas anguilliseptica]|uniref:protein O-GlcNAc transferase n=1 Tax=Pseudomonas anguilliseptica TaxID=53406 RepID=A0A1H5J2F1_PSEAG|nr:tetratricopeptide repeat protein [Pseudomonas anguilliseptica]SEE46610.1 Predicted O-linked N-acetylglucosamine transferase, SPINDLY family [Pseudomonas anguilliseptica]